MDDGRDDDAKRKKNPLMYINVLILIRHAKTKRTTKANASTAKSGADKACEDGGDTNAKGEAGG